MKVGGKMSDPFDVFRPLDVIRIAGTSDNELLLFQELGRLDKKASDRRLSVIAVSSQISKGIFFPQIHGVINFRIYRTVQRPSPFCPIFFLQKLKHLTA